MDSQKQSAVTAGRNSEMVKYKSTTDLIYFPDPPAQSPPLLLCLYYLQLSRRLLFLEWSSIYFRFLTFITKSFLFFWASSIQNISFENLIWFHKSSILHSITLKSSQFKITEFYSNLNHCSFSTAAAAILSGGFQSEIVILLKKSEIGELKWSLFQFVWTTKSDCYRQKTLKTPTLHNKNLTDLKCRHDDIKIHFTTKLQSNYLQFIKTV